MKKNKINITTVIVSLMYMTGILIFLYPVISNIINTHNQSTAVANYGKTVSYYQQNHKKELKIIKDKAIQYNKKLYQKGVNLYKGKGNFDDYDQQLLLKGSDVIGYIEIPSINVKLPIYHGTEEQVLQKGVGHMEGTSLPIGGKNTHSVLSGHRGLPSGGVLFSNLNLVQIGDIFRISIFNEQHFYKVEHIRTVLPNDINNLKIKPNQDLITLVTCTPYGVNTHRLLVEGKRVFLNLNIISNSKNIKPIKVSLILFAGILAVESLVLISYRGIKKWMSNRN